MASETAEGTTLDVLRRLESGPRGLTEPEAASRLAAYGENTLPDRRTPSWTRRCVRALRDPFTAVLLCLGLVSAAVASWGTAVRNGLEPWRLLIVAIVLFGSEKLPDTARPLGRSMRILKGEAKAPEGGGRFGRGARGAAPGCRARGRRIGPVARRAPRAGSRLAAGLRAAPPAPGARSSPPGSPSGAACG
jgi:hypothetical protein